MKEKIVLTFLLIIILPWIVGCLDPIEPVIRNNDDDDNGHEIIVTDMEIATYIRTWSSWTVNRIKGEYLSEFIIAFARISETDGYSLYIPAVTNNTFPNLWNEVAALKVKFPHMKIKLSVGGGSERGFPAMSADPVKRANFAANLCQWVVTRNLDGVDIDWEFPVRPITGGVEPTERDTYIALLQEVRNALDDLGEQNDRYYSLSAAVPVQRTFTTDNDVEAAANIVDQLKLMAYDFYGSWSATTGHNVKLYSDPSIPLNNPESNSIDRSINAYIDAGVPPGKISLGIAFYGFYWDGIDAGDNANAPGLLQPRNPTSSRDQIAWSNLRSNLNPSSGFIRYWDDIAKAPFLYNSSSKRWITYTDHEQIELLAAYAKEKKLGGVFIWELFHDPDNELLQTLVDNLQSED